MNTILKNYGQEREFGIRKTWWDARSMQPNGLDGIVSVSGFAPVRERLSGWQKALITAGIPVVALAATA